MSLSPPAAAGPAGGPGSESDSGIALRVRAGPGPEGPGPTVLTGGGPLSVVKSHFNRTRSFVIEQLLSKSEKRFVRTHWLQEVLGLSEVL